MSFATHEIHGQIGIVLTSVATAVKNGAQRQSVGLSLMNIALVLCADVPVQPLIPLHRIVTGAKVYEIVVIEFAVIGIWSRIKAQDILSDRINLIRTKDILLAIADKRLPRVGSVRFVQLRWRSDTRQISVQQLREVALALESRRNVDRSRIADRNAVCFNVAEIEELVFPDREP